MSKAAQRDMTKAELRDRLGEDSDRRPFEKETGFLFNKDSDRVDVTVAERSIMNRLLAHDDFEVKDYETNSSGEVIQVNGTVGIEYLLVKGKGRTNTQHAGVVSDGTLD